MASELQTVVVEHPNSRPCARDCRFADPRAVEVAVLVQRDCRRGFFIPARRSVRPMADASCPVSEQENVRVGQTLAGSAGSTPPMTRVGLWASLRAPWCRGEPSLGATLSPHRV